MHTKVLPNGSRDLLAEIAKSVPSPLQGWVLAGGTGLALHLGHRLSEDFDFFKTATMDVRKLHAAVRELGPCEALLEESGTLTVLLRGIKISFFQIRDRFLFPSFPYSFFKVADVRDIALMKLVAIANRGSRKDFVDLYALLRQGSSLQELLALLPRKYGRGRVNEYQILKSLTFFDDAEREPLPRLLGPFDWRECKAFFVREAQAVIL